MRRHVLRNALIPTVAVIAVQIGYLFGGIIAVEKIFNYNGMGATMLFAAQHKDLPMLTAGVDRHRHRVHAGDAAADLIMAWMNPRIRLDADQLMDVIVEPDTRSDRTVAAPVSERSQARRETHPAAAPPAGVHHRQHHHHRLDHLRPSSASGSRRTTRSTTSPPGTCRRARST